MQAASKQENLRQKLQQEKLKLKHPQQEHHEGDRAEEKQTPEEKKAASEKKEADQKNTDEMAALLESVVAVEAGVRKKNLKAACAAFLNHTGGAAKKRGAEEPANTTNTTLEKAKPKRKPRLIRNMAKCISKEDDKLIRHTAL